LVQVWIRHSRGVRGCCHGNVLAFDRHMNVVSNRIVCCVYKFY
jgi:small nuclear ribonucleoprotein (snRNP)-like protein